MADREVCGDLGPALGVDKEDQRKRGRGGEIAWEELSTVEQLKRYGRVALLCGEAMALLNMERASCLRPPLRLLVDRLGPLITAKRVQLERERQEQWLDWLDKEEAREDIREDVRADLFDDHEKENEDD